MPKFQTNEIFIYGGSFTDVKKALRQWIDSYVSQLDPDFIFKIYKNSAGNHVIQADERLDNTLFYFLVNYIGYPEGIDYKVTVEGFTIGTERNALKGKELMIFLSEFDTECDNVMIVTEENKVYKMDFGGKLSESTENRVYRKPSFISSVVTDVLKVKGTKKSVKDELENEQKLDKRLKWMFIVIIGLQAFNFLLIRPFSVDPTITFESVSFFLFIGMSGWFFYDYKILRNEKRYLKCLGLSALLLIHISLITYLKMVYLNEFEFGLVVFPVILLLIQWPLRLLFISIFNKEPEVEYRSRSLRNFLYVSIWVLVSAAISLKLVGII
ncbi:hypothetical protein [Fluviicola taffensis]|uniref:hypothetical protein n=1 Tax=Fluviicola taffensis TaxID=191579 RepID=UPI003137CB75